MVKLWSTSTLQQEGTALNTDPAATSMIAFEPGGRRLLVIDDRGNGFTWPMSLTAWEQRVRRRRTQPHPTGMGPIREWPQLRQGLSLS
jgi:hypothetical protein